MKPNDKAYQEAIETYNIHSAYDAESVPLRLAVDAAYAAQFQSEDYAGLVKELRDGIIEHRRRWSGDTHDDLGGTADYERTHAMTNCAADAIEALLAEIAAARAECERLNKSRNRWGKKYNDCLGKLRLAVMSESDECKELTAQNDNIRAELAAVTAERDRMREALKPFAAQLDHPGNTYEHNGVRMALVNQDILDRLCRRARAALEGVKEPPR